MYQVCRIMAHLKDSILTRFVHRYGKILVGMYKDHRDAESVVSEMMLGYLPAENIRIYRQRSNTLLGRILLAYIYDLIVLLYPYPYYVYKMLVRIVLNPVKYVLCNYLHTI